MHTLVPYPPACASPHSCPPHSPSRRPPFLPLPLIRHQPPSSAPLPSRELGVLATPLLPKIAQATQISTLRRKFDAEREREERETLGEHVCSMFSHSAKRYKGRRCTQWVRLLCTLHQRNQCTTVVPSGVHSAVSYWRSAATGPFQRAAIKPRTESKE